MNRDLSPILLSNKDKFCIIDQALLLLEQIYVHLPQKKASYAILPEQRLKNLKRDIINQVVITDLQFHRQMLRIFNSLRDLHTQYMMPVDSQKSIMSLPFNIEACFSQSDTNLQENEPKIIVTRVDQSNAEVQSNPTFQPGVQVHFWNGVPILTAIERLAEQMSGGNLAARFVHALRGLVQRSLRFSLPPEEEWVIVGYEDLNSPGHIMEARFHWETFGDAIQGVTAKNGQVESTLGVDLETERLFRHRLQRFPKDQSQQDLSPFVAGDTQCQLSEEINTNYPWSFSLRLLSVKEKSGETQQKVGYLRIYSFATSAYDSNYPSSSEIFIQEVGRLLRILSSKEAIGLIIDVRSNGGGNINAAEQLLQLLSPTPISPENFQMLCSPQNAELCRSEVYSGFAQWGPSIEQAAIIADLYSSAFPLTLPALSGTPWQNGPIIVITDAFSYSATDMFVAGFLDNQLGQVIGVDGNTGAGGANVVRHSDLVQLMPNSSFMSLPDGVEMRVAFRRSFRVRNKQGILLEDLGITPDQRYYYTRNDLLNKNVDLLLFAVNKIADLATSLDVSNHIPPKLKQDDSSVQVKSSNGKSGNSQEDSDFYHFTLTQGTPWNEQTLKKPIKVQLSNANGQPIATGKLHWNLPVLN